MYKIKRTLFHLLENIVGLLKSKINKRVPPKKMPKTSKSLSLINSKSSLNDSKFIGSKIKLKKLFKSPKKLFNLKKNTKNLQLLLIIKNLQLLIIKNLLKKI